MIVKALLKLIGVLAVGIAAIGTALFVLMERGVELDELHGLKVGMTKAVALQQLSNGGVPFVVPEIWDHRVIRREQVADLESALTPPGVCITDSKGATAHFIINTDGRVSLTYQSASAIGRVAKTETVPQLAEELRASFGDKPNLIVGRCVADSHWINTTGASTDDVAYLMRQSAWGFHLPNSYSTAVLKFDGDSLSRIRFFWRPFELP